MPYQVSGLQGITMAACGDAFTLAIGAGKQDMCTSESHNTDHISPSKAKEMKIKPIFLTV